MQIDLIYYFKKHENEDHNFAVINIYGLKKNWTFLVFCLKQMYHMQSCHITGMVKVSELFFPKTLTRKLSITV